MIYLFLSLVLGGPSPSADVLSTIGDVRRAVDAREVRSVDQIWRRFPLWMTGQPALVRNTPSPVAATARYPRMVTVDDEGQLFAAAGTARWHPTYRQLELASADPTTGEISIHLVDFRREPRITRNPASCLGCHSVNGVIRLRVEPYPHWPGWFGHADRMQEEHESTLAESERNAMLRFFSSQRRTPRLLANFFDGFRFEELAHQNALRVTVMAVRAEARAAFLRLKQTPAYARVRLALAASRPDDDERFANWLEPDLRHSYLSAVPFLDRELSENSLRYAARTNEAFRRVDGASWQLHRPSLSYADLIPFEWAFRQAGLTLASYSTSATPGVLNINTGIGTLSEYLRELVHEDLAAEFDLVDWFRKVESGRAGNTSLPEPWRYADEFIPAVRARMCERLIQP